jgi:hypothetical protein
MPTSRHPSASQELTVGAACAALEPVLAGSMRQQLVDDASGASDLRRALLRLRDRMRANAWEADGARVRLERIVNRYDALTRAEGFHVLHDWDGKADTVNEDIIPVDVLHYIADQRGEDPADATVLAILIDYYFVHLLELLSVRAWDDGDADENFDRLTQLLTILQGPGGSGQLFARNAETLLLLATSHFELHERGYTTLLDRVRTLNERHRVNIALGHAASMGSHLRFGFEATYGRDTIVMRNDNVADYPWLCFALSTLMRTYAQMHARGEHGADRQALVEAMLNGLTADARAFIGEPPASLSRCDVDRAELARGFERFGDDLLEEFEEHRPADESYSPLSFFFNFSHNVMKGTIVDALLRSEPWALTFDDLLTSIPRHEPTGALKTRLAKTLMGYARANPDRIRGRLMPVIVYDPQAGRQAFVVAMKKMRPGPR